jgi:hypothetical protein
MAIKREKHPVTFRLWPESYAALKRLAAVTDVTRNNILNRIICQLDQDTQKRLAAAGADVAEYLAGAMTPPEFHVASTEYWMSKLAKTNKPAEAVADSNGVSEPATNAA